MTAGQTFSGIVLPVAKCTETVILRERGKEGGRVEEREGGRKGRREIKLASAYVNEGRCQSCYHILSPTSALQFLPLGCNPQKEP